MPPLPLFDLSSHPYGFWSLVPPLVAIALAILTRRIILSLALSVFTGAIILSSYSEPAEMVAYESVLGLPASFVTNFMHYWTWLGTVITETWTVHLWPTATDPEKISVFLFTCLMGSIVGMVNRSAGMRGLLHLLAPITKTPRSGQVVTGVSGLLVFFDDYANTLLIGTTYRSMCDKLRISREKLAYIVDSTAAPVSGLAFISTWIAGELGYIDSGLRQVVTPEGTNSFVIFMDSIPYRFYVLWALFFVFVVAIMRKDFGPMAKAERKARMGNGASDSGDEFLLPENLDYDHMKIDRNEINSDVTEAITLAKDATQAPSGTKARALNAIVPILFTSAAILFFMYRSGLDSIMGSAESAAKLKEAESIWVSLRYIIGDADPYGSLVWGSGVGFGFTYLWLAIQRITPKGALSSAAASGAAHMFASLVILWLASSLSNMTKGDPSSNYNDISSKAAIVASQVTSDSWDGSKEADRQKLISTLKASLKDSGSPSATESIIAATLAEYYSDQETFHNEVTSKFQSEILKPDFYERYTKVEKTPERKKEAGKEAETTLTEKVSFKYQDVRNRLHTGRYLSSFFTGQGKESREWMLRLLPTIIFVLAGFTAFCTGTSWGTMGLVTPLSITLYAGLAGGISAEVDTTNAIFLCTVGSVLAGAVFGDHCSPISDTTVLSSQASGCHHLSHVWTQLPYALTVGLVTVVFGTLPIGFGVPLFVTLPIGTVVLVAALWFFGENVDDDPETTKTTN